MESAHASALGPRAYVRSANVAWLLGLCLPLAAYALQLKVARVIERRVPVRLVDVPGLFGSDLAMQLCFASLCYAVLSYVSSSAVRRVVKAGLTVAGLLYVLVLLAAHGYFMSSGTSLDYPMLAFSLLHIDDTAKVIATASSSSRVIILGLTVCAVLGLPWLLERRIQLGPRITRASDRFLAMTLGSAAACGCLAIAIDARSADGLEVARDPMLNVLLTYTTATDDDVAWIERAAKHPRGARRLAAGPATRKKNVVIILLESTGAWATSVYGEHDTTPFLAELAEKSLVADRMYTVVPHTSKALVASLCGVEPMPGVGVPEALSGGLPGVCLPELLRDQGYSTMMMQSATREFENRPQLAQSLGFESFLSGDEMQASGLARANYFGYEDRILLGPVRKWLKERDRSRPFLFTVLTNTPHHDYQPARHYGTEKLASEPMRNRYLNNVRYQDFVLRELFQAFEEDGAAKDTIFLLFGDHGEGLGQHRRYAHDDVIYEEGMHIPFLIYEPEGGRAAGRLTGPFNELDVAPTVLDLLGLEVREGRYVGRSVLLPNTKRVLYGACYNDFKCITRYEGGLKLIDFFERQKTVLYDLANDPGERRDLSRERASEVESARRDLRGWYGAVRTMYRQVIDRGASEFVTRTKPKVQFARKIAFGEYVELVGVSTSKGEVEPGGWLNVTYTFYVREPLPAGYRLFVHGYDGSRRYPWDHIPVQRMYPEENWQAGQYISDKHRIRVPPEWRGDKLVVRGGFWSKGVGRIKPTPRAPDDAPVFIELPVRKR